MPSRSAHKSPSYTKNRQSPEQRRVDPFFSPESDGYVVSPMQPGEGDQQPRKPSPTNDRFYSAMSNAMSLLKEL